MAFITAEVFGMHTVAKDSRAHRTLHGNIHRAAMTTAAVALNTKRGPSVMTGPAGRTVLHFLHADRVAVGHVCDAVPR